MKVEKDEIILEPEQNFDNEIDLDALGENLGAIQNHIALAAKMSNANKWQYLQNVGKWSRAPLDYEYILSLENPGDSKEIPEKMTWNKIGDAARVRELKKI